jgi:hypothetical protein
MARLGALLHRALEATLRSQATIDRSKAALCTAQEIMSGRQPPETE